MPPISRLVVVVLALVVSVTALPASAAPHGEDGLLLASGSTPGDGWASVSVELEPGGELSFEQWTRGVITSTVMGIALVDEDGDTLFTVAAMKIFGRPGTICMTGQGTAPPGTWFTTGGRGPDEWLSGIILENSGHTPVRYVIAAWGTGSGSSYDWSLTSTGGARTFDSHTGEEAFFADAERLQASAVASAGSLTGFAGAAMEVEGTGRLFGAFLTYAGPGACAPMINLHLVGARLGTAVLRIEGPDGVRLGTSHFIGGAPPGRYAFHADAYSAQPHPNELLLSGAFVQLPELPS